jgi:putative CRISPR-associated protein (TIGR02619 family)
MKKQNEKNILMYVTCGTSTLTNLTRGTTLNIYKYSNLKDLNDIKDLDERQALNAVINTAFDKIFNLNTAEAKKASAELNSIYSYFKDELPNNLKVALIYTDTYFGVIVSQLLKKYLNKNHPDIKVDFITAERLNTNSLHEFAFGFQNLLYQLSDYSKDHQYYFISMNLTGGFKSLNAILESASDKLADESFYLFEGSSEVLKIPKGLIGRILK